VKVVTVTNCHIYFVSFLFFVKYYYVQTIRCYGPVTVQFTDGVL